MSDVEALQAELASELRAVQLALVATVASPAALEVAIEQVRAARSALTGPEREPWYAALDSEGRPATLNFNTFSLYRGEANPLAPGLQSKLVTWPDGRRGVEGRVRCNRLYEGPPNGVHGGYVAGLFDDVLGGTIRLVDGPSAVTGTLTVRYRKLTPLDTELTFRGWVEHDSGRRIVSKATCHAGEVLTAEAEALFVRVDMQALAAGQPNYRPR